ncbi:MAG: YkvA family protein [Tunicatimonas sp.]
MGLFDKANDSSSFKKAKRQASGILQDPERLRNLVDKSVKKIKDLRNNSDEMQDFQRYVGTFNRMIKAYSSKEYQKTPWKTLLLAVAGIIYFVSPLDLIPDFIPVIGYLDDISVLLWIANSAKGDLEEFEEWEETYAETA